MGAPLLIIQAERIMKCSWKKWEEEVQVEVSPRARIKKGRVGGGRRDSSKRGRERALNSKCNKKEGGRERGREGVTH